MITTILALTLMTERDEVYARLAAEREAAIERLRAYRDAGVFPGGFDPGAMVPADDPHYNPDLPLVHTFIAPNGALCAVAHLIAESGRRDIVDRVANEHNSLCSGTTEDEEILAWILNSGLTREEVIRIQLPAMEEPVANVDWIAGHLEQVERELTENTEASLQIAVDRWMEAN